MTCSRRRAAASCLCSTRSWFCRGAAAARPAPSVLPARPAPGGPAGPVEGDLFEGFAGEGVDLLRQAVGAHAQRGELYTAVVEFAEDLLRGDLLVHDQHVGV